jgi:hypothetical protein
VETPSSPPEKNRRTSPRRSGKGGVQVACRMNALGLGPNVAVALLDVSDAGARLTVRTPLLPGQEVEVELCGIGRGRPVKILAEVMWCVASTATEFQVGLRFRRYLTYQDLQELGR